MHVVLVGMMASGKSSIGKVLSKSMNIPFLISIRRLSFMKKEASNRFLKTVEKDILENLKVKL